MLFAPLSNCAQETKKQPAKPNAASEDSFDGEGLAGGSSIDDVTGEVDVSLDNILADCGVREGELDDLDSDRVLFKKDLRSWPKIVTGTKMIPFLGPINYRVEVTTKVSIKSKPGETTQTTDFDIVATPSQALKQADKQVAPLRGTIKTKGMSMTMRRNLISKQSQWNGVFCTIQPTKQMTISRNNKTKVIKYSPALPYTLSPKAIPARYTAEIGESRVFDNITAEIVSSDDVGYQPGRKIRNGRVTIRRVNPVLSLDAGTAGTQTLRADAAYRLEFDFGTDTTALGLNKSQTMYFNQTEKDLKMVVTDTGLPESGVIVLFDSNQ